MVVPPHSPVPRRKTEEGGGGPACMPPNGPITTAQWPNGPMAPNGPVATAEKSGERGRVCPPLTSNVFLVTSQRELGEGAVLPQQVGRERR